MPSTEYDRGVREASVDISVDLISGLLQWGGASGRVQEANSRRCVKQQNHHGAKCQSKTLAPALTADRE